MAEGPSGRSACIFHCVSVIRWISASSSETDPAPFLTLIVSSLSPLESDLIDTVKVYESDKVANEEGGWQYSKITLKLYSTDSRCQAMVFEGVSVVGLVVTAVTVAEIGCDVSLI